MPTETKIAETATTSDRPVCGLVMPISAMDSCSEQHWIDVKQILSDAIEGCGFAANLVSHATDVGVIQKRIIQNLYENPMIVCDVSGRNPNVMFELGIRLAFDKPTIIVKDDKTAFSFDTGAIEHLEYPRDLRFGKIVEFKTGLQDKIIGTIKKAKEDPLFSTFLKHFGQFTVAKLDTKEITNAEFLAAELAEIKSMILRPPRVSSRLQKTEEELAKPLRRLRVRDELTKLLAERGLQDKSMLDVNEHYEQLKADVEQRIIAPRYFRSPEEYEALFKEVLMDLLPPF